MTISIEKKVWTDEEFSSPDIDRLLKRQDALDGADIVSGFSMTV
jgi:hypothetical protein